MLWQEKVWVCAVEGTGEGTMVLENGKTLMHTNEKECGQQGRSLLVVALNGGKFDGGGKRGKMLGVQGKKKLCVTVARNPQVS